MSEAALEFDRRTDRQAATLLHDARAHEILAAVYASARDRELQRRATELLRTADALRSAVRGMLGLSEGDAL
jgi:hypothetical protein